MGSVIFCLAVGSFMIGFLLGSVYAYKVSESRQQEINKMNINRDNTQFIDGRVLKYDYL